MKLIKILITFFLLSFSTQLLSFTLNNNVAASFRQNEVSINVANFTCERSNLSPEEILDLASRAMDQFWNTVPTSRLRLRRGQVLNVDEAFRDQSVCESGQGSNEQSCDINENLVVSNDILITCNNNEDNFQNSPRNLAVALPNNIQARTINGAIITLNNIEDTRLAGQSPSELKAILAHEVGHAIGLGHSPVKDSLMYFTLVETRNRLGWDDIDGVSYLYPKEQPVSCGTIQDIKNRGPRDGALMLGFIFLFGLILSFSKKIGLFVDRSTHTLRANFFR